MQREVENIERRKSYGELLFSGTWHALKYGASGVFASCAFVVPKALSIAVNASKEFFHVAQYNLNWGFAENPNYNMNVATMLERMQEAYSNNILPIEENIEDDEFSIDNLVSGLHYFSEAALAIQDCQSTWLDLSLYSPTNILAIWKQKSELKKTFEVAMENDYKYLSQYLKDFDLALNACALEREEVQEELENIQNILKALSNLRGTFGRDGDILISNLEKMIAENVENTFGENSVLRRNLDSGLNRINNESIETYIVRLLECLPNMTLPEIIRIPIAFPDDLGSEGGDSVPNPRLQIDEQHLYYDDARQYQAELDAMRREEIQHLRYLRRLEEYLRLKRDQEEQARRAKRIARQNRGQGARRRTQGHGAEISNSRSAFRSFAAQREVISAELSNTAQEIAEETAGLTADDRTPSSLFTNRHTNSVLHMYSHAANNLNLELIRLQEVWRQREQEVQEANRRIREADPARNAQQNRDRRAYAY